MEHGRVVVGGGSTSGLAFGPRRNAGSRRGGAQAVRSAGTTAPQDTSLSAHGTTGTTGTTGIGKDPATAGSAGDGHQLPSQLDVDSRLQLGSPSQTSKARAGTNQPAGVPLSSRASGPQANASASASASGLLHTLLLTSRQNSDIVRGADHPDLVARVDAKVLKLDHSDSEFRSNF
jgi:hypothetical protein